MSFKKIIFTLFSAGAGGGIGYVFGKALHDAILGMGIYNFQKLQWFNTTEYLKLYYQYSNGLDNLFGLIFAILGLGIGGLIGYQIAEALDYEERTYKKYYGWL